MKIGVSHSVIDTIRQQMLVSMSAGSCTCWPWSRRNYLTEGVGVPPGVVEEERVPFADTHHAYPEEASARNNFLEIRIRFELRKDCEGQVRESGF